MTPANPKTGPSAPGPRTGAYYWIPRPGPDGLAWDLTTCHDFDVSDGISHREFWPHVVERLAAGWGKKSSALKRRLRDHYAGLPRGRVTRPGGKTFIFHGEDSPVPDWQERVISAFRLDPRATRTPTDEHERMLWDDRRRVEGALGIDLGRDTARGGQRRGGPPRKFLTDVRAVSRTEKLRLLRTVADELLREEGDLLMASERTTGRPEVGMYLWLCCEGWVRFGPFEWLRFEEEPRAILDQSGAVVASYDGSAWRTPGEAYRGFQWCTPMVTLSARDPSRLLRSRRSSRRESP